MVGPRGGNIRLRNGKFIICRVHCLVWSIQNLTKSYQASRMEKAAPMQGIWVAKASFLHYYMQALISWKHMHGLLLYHSTATHCLARQRSTRELPLSFERITRLTRARP